MELFHLSFKVVAINLKMSTAEVFMFRNLYIKLTGPITIFTRFGRLIESLSFCTFSGIVTLCPKYRVTQ